MVRAAARRATTSPTASACACSTAAAASQVRSVYRADHGYLEGHARHPQALRAARRGARQEIRPGPLQCVHRLRRPVGRGDPCSRCASSRRCSGSAPATSPPPTLFHGTLELVEPRPRVPCSWARTRTPSSMSASARFLTRGVTGDTDIKHHRLPSSRSPASTTGSPRQSSPRVLTVLVTRPPCGSSETVTKPTQVPSPLIISLTTKKKPGAERVGY